MNTLVHTDRLVETVLAGVPSGSTRAAPGFVQAWRQRWTEASERRHQVAADRQLWNAALNDPRIMAEIVRAQEAEVGERRKRRMMRSF